MPDIVIHRRAAYADRQQPYCVVIDDELRGTIGQDETFRATVTPGEHTVHLTHDRVGSPTLTVDATRDVHLTCRPGVPSGKRTGLFFLMNTLTFGRDQWIRLTEDERPGHGR